MLSKVERFASGFDKVPYWLFCHCAGLFTGVISHVFNIILTVATGPDVWECVSLSHLFLKLDPYSIQGFAANSSYIYFIQIVSPSCC